MSAVQHIPCRPMRSVSPPFPTRVQAALRDLADQRRVTAPGFPVSEGAVRHAAGIERLGAYIGAADLEDPRLVALSVAGQATSEGGTWAPGAEQRRVLAGIGREVLGIERVAAHDMEAMFTELACAAVEDTY